MHMRNFYALDTETTGFDHNHPLQISAVLFIDGKPKATNNQYLMTAIEIQPEAYSIHGLSKEKLKDLGAVQWSKGCSDVLANFLGVHRDFPIVAHNVQYDLDTVMKPAFERVGNMARLPKPDRWVCTQELSRNIPGLLSHQLDDVLQHLGMQRRPGQGRHDALNDALLCGEAYMRLVVQQKDMSENGK